MTFLYDPSFWVAVAFLILVGVFIRVGVPGMVTRSLDERRAKIQTELDEARRLKEEAQALLSAYQRKQQDAEREAAAILEGAQAEAQRLAAEAQGKIEEFVARRTKMAEAKIVQAEQQAVADVRAAAAEAAVAAAEKLLSNAVRGATADGLIEQGIRDVKAKLN